MITQQKRLKAACIRFVFEFAKSIGIFWFIEIVPFLKIKEPYNKMYQRYKINQ